MAAVALPPLLPTPCLVIMPSSFAPPTSSKPMPGRADSVDRWDANKTKPSNPASSAASGSPGRASGCERWDSSKKCPLRSTSSSSNSSKIPARVSACERWDSNRRPASRSSSAERWDIHKKPRAHETTGGLDDGNHSDAVNPTCKNLGGAKTAEPKETTSSATAEMVKLPPMMMFAGVGFPTSPEPSTLPIPAFSLKCR